MDRYSTPRPPIKIFSGSASRYIAEQIAEQYGVSVGKSAFIEFSDGTGPIDAVFNAISKVTGKSPELLRYSITALTGGTDAQGEVTVRLKDDNGKIALGKGAHPDILTASAKAYINGLNRLAKLAMVEVSEKADI